MIKNFAISFKKTLKRDFGAWALIFPALFCIYYAVLRPQVFGFVWSFFDMNGYTPDKFVGLENFRVVLSDTAFLKTLFNTLQYVFWSVLIGYTLPVVAALLMNEMIHFRKTIRTIMYLPAVLPGVCVSLLWFFMYYPDNSGLLNALLQKFGLEPYSWLQDGNFTILYIVLSMAWSATGSTALYYFAGLQSINRELYEAAVIDGAGFFTRLRVVTFPQMSGMLLIFLIRHIIGIFGITDQPLQMTGGGPNNASMSLGLLNYHYAFTDGQPQYALALGVVMFVILLVPSIAYFKLNKKVEENL